MSYYGNSGDHYRETSKGPVHYEPDDDYDRPAPPQCPRCGRFVSARDGRIVETIPARDETLIFMEEREQLADDGETWLPVNVPVVHQYHHPPHAIEYLTCKKCGRFTNNDWEILYPPAPARKGQKTDEPDGEDPFAND